MALRGVGADVGAGEDAVGDAGAGVVEDKAVDEDVGAVEAVVDVVAGEAAVEFLYTAWGGVEERGSPLGQLQHKERQRVPDRTRTLEFLFSFKLNVVREAH